MISCHHLHIYVDCRCRWSARSLEQSWCSKWGKDQRKLKQNFSFVGTKIKACVPSWVCDVCAFGCCRASSTAGTFWVFALPLRLNTHFFGESVTTLTCADANSMGNWELLQTPVFSSPPRSISPFNVHNTSSTVLSLTILDQLVLLFLLFFHFLAIISSHCSHHLPLLCQRSFGAS